MKSIVILTSDDIRHNYFKVMFANAPGLQVLRTYSESQCRFQLRPCEFDSTELSDVNAMHFVLRHNTEYDYFSDIINMLPDSSKTVYIEKNEINNSGRINEIIELDPDFIITYGCSIIKGQLLAAFKNRIINVHLGISPYYFGSGTNYHALVNGDFQCVGYTFMFMDQGIDTGKIIHQARAVVHPFDNPHQIGNRLIKNMTSDFIKLMLNFDKVIDITAVTAENGKTYKRKDATPETVVKLYRGFSDGAVLTYLQNAENLKAAYPIVQQPFMMETE